MAVEGKTSGKNTTTDQRQVQATSQSGSVFTGDGPVNTGLNVQNSGAGDINLTDQGAVDAAFDFAKYVSNGAGQILADTVTANSDTLKSASDSVLANSGAGQDKTMLYIILAVLGLMGVIFFLKR